MSEPKDHHYVPVFYLSRWQGSDGCVCRFSRPNGKEVKAKRFAPKGTAFEHRLYETHGLPPEQAQTMEKDFMSKIDDNAAKALTILENDLQRKGLTSADRSSWSRFLWTQMFRAPRDIAQLKSSVKQEWNKESQTLRESYAARRSSDDPVTFEQYMEQHNPSYADELAFSVARTLMDHSQICHLLNEMHWCVLGVPQGCNLLLTSDNPVYMTLTLVADDDFLLMAIGPRRLFVATVKPETLCRIQTRPRGELVNIINMFTVQRADRYVYGLTDDMLPFVQEHLSTKRRSTWIERLAAMRGHEIVAPDSPSTQL